MVERTEDFLPPSAPTEGVVPSSPSSSSPSSTSSSGGDRVAGFRILRLLGQGGMAAVYEAVDDSGQRVALKRVREDARRDPAFVERFLREVRAARKLDHPNCCKVYAGGTDGDDVFMAVELIDGGDLDQLLARAGGRLPAAVAASVVLQLLEALDHAHGAGLVHRDIKPANVMLTRAGVVKLVDFGIARSHDDVKLTATGLVVGTPAYMSPEQARGEALDARSDLFSVGVMFAELLLGANPFQGDTATATVMKILTTSVPPLHALEPTVPGVVAHVVTGLLQRQAAQRYPSARAAIDDLAPYVRLLNEQVPELVRLCVDDPVGGCARLRRAQAEFERERAHDLRAHGALPAAALASHRAVTLVPDDAALRALYDDVIARGAFDLAPTEPRIAQLEAEIARAPLQPALLKRAADLHRAAHNPLGQATWLLRYLHVQPTDQVAQQQCDTLLHGPRETLAALPRARLSTREIVDGIRTGGWRATSTPTETALPAPRPARAPAPARPVVQGTNAIVVVDRSDSSSVLVKAAVVSIAIVLVAGALWGFGRTTTDVAADVQHTIAGRAGPDADAAVRAMTLQHLTRARALIAERNGVDALAEVDAVLRLQPTGGEYFDALFIKARALALDSQRDAAADVLRDYLDRAPISHGDYAEATALQKRMGR